MAQKLAITRQKISSRVAWVVGDKQEKMSSTSPSCAAHKPRGDSYSAGQWFRPSVKQNIC